MPVNQSYLKPADVFMESKITRYVMAAVLTAVLAGVPVRYGLAFSRPAVVRVAVLKEVQAFSLTVRGSYRIINPATNEELRRGRRLRRCDVKSSQGGILIGDQFFNVPRLRLIAKKDAAIDKDGKTRRYRGRLDIIRDKENKFLVINTVDLEMYVRGVLYHEVPHAWPLNAIMAQAVATRTYALYQVGQRKNQEYDVTSDIYSQVYGGRSAERHRSNVAANRTRGEILTYNGKVLPAYFHSNCGGHTESAAELWKHDLPPLKGVDCRFCENAPNYRWKKNFRSLDIQKTLNLHGFNMGSIQKLQVLDRTDSGRVKTLKVVTRDGGSVNIPGTRFREIIGPNVLKSNYYEIEMKGYYFDVIGRGWGHGVGMCQWGIYRMARERYDYKDTLEYYYPGATWTKVSP